MPLPPALAARLAKRGLLSGNEPQDRTDREEEEVIAEDYDEPNKQTFQFSLGDSKAKVVAIGCPNKYNIYHDCNSFCLSRWGTGKQEPSPTTKRKYQHLLKRYPLSEGWQDVYDPGV